MKERSTKAVIFLNIHGNVLNPSFSHFFQKFSYIESCLWTRQISAVQQYFLTIASFLTLILDWNADSTILIGPQSSCNTAEISWTQTPCKKVIICQTDCTIYCWLIVTVDTPAPVHLMKQLKYATGWSWVWMWLVDKMQRCAKI